MLITHHRNHRNLIVIVPAAKHPRNPLVPDSLAAHLTFVATREAAFALTEARRGANASAGDPISVESLGHAPG